MEVKLNRPWKNKNGSGIVISSDYLQYCAEGGKLSARDWNTRQRELLKESKPLIN